MCDYGDLEPAQFWRSKMVTIRKRQRCGECGLAYPVGTRMEYQVGVTCDGLFDSYTCPTCHYMTHQPESSPFHACADGSDDPKLSIYAPEWQEVQRALLAGQMPDPTSPLANMSPDDRYDYVKRAYEWMKEGYEPLVVNDA